MDRTDFVLLLFNVVTSVAIVFANRILLDWCSFKYASCLTGLHLLVSGLFVRMYRGTPKKTEIPRAELVVFVLCSSISIVSLNLSLLLNSVTFYQISKLLIIPVTAVVELVLLHSVMSGWRIICSCCAVAGVAVVTINDLHLSLTLYGASMAMISVITSALQQVFVRKLQKQYSVASMDLLSSVAPLSATLVITVGPVVDYMVGGSWVTSYTWNSQALLALALSCSLAILVNISQFSCLGRFSAVSFQVMGHLKTVLVFLISWVMLGETMPPIKLAGIGLTLAGIILYSINPDVFYKRKKATHETTRVP